MKKKLSAFVLTLVILITGRVAVKLAIGFLAASQSPNSTAENVVSESPSNQISVNESSGEIILATNGYSSISVPDGWVNVYTEGDTEVIKMANPSKHARISIIDFKTSEVPEGSFNLTLEGLAGVYNTEIPSITETTINGYPAQQAELTGSLAEFENMLLTLRLVWVQTADRSYMITVGFPANSDETVNPELDQVLQTFTLTPETTEVSQSSIE
ncbi:MAG: hypothetical protein AAFY20_21175 [Cyanobacteria bacterium J06639_14]